MGSNPWAGFRDTMRNSADAFDLPTVDVYNYSGGYDEATGDTDWTRDSSPTATFQAQVQIDQPGVVSDASGLQTQDGDADMLVRDDIESKHGFTFYPVGTNDQKPTEVEYDGRVFLVADVMDRDNGLLLVPLVEADR